jgi:hypothetical protein
MRRGLLPAIGFSFLLGTASASLCLAGATPSFAADSLRVSAQVGEPLREARALAQAGQFQEALAKVREADAVPNKTPAEILTIQRFYVYLYVKLGDYSDAAAASNGELATGLLSPAETRTTKRNIPIFYAAAGDWDDTLYFANQYLLEYGPDAEIQKLINVATNQGGDERRSSFYRRNDGTANVPPPPPKPPSALPPEPSVSPPDPAKVAARHKQLVAKYGEKVAGAIESGKVLIGMSKDAVLEALGKPLSTQVIPPNDELWIYRSWRIVFENGQVSYVGH